MVIFRKIVSAIVAFIMSIIGIVMPPSGESPAPFRGEVISTGSNYRINTDAPVICRSYKEFELFCDLSNSDELDKYIEDLDKAYFENYCIIAVNIEVPDPSYKVYVTSAGYTDKRTFEVHYTKANYPYVAASVISYETIVLFADKDIRKVDLERDEDMILNFYPQDSMGSVYSIASAAPVHPYYPEDDGCFEGYYIFEDYESWVEFRDNGNWSFSNYTDIAANESFFERNNLVVAITTLSDSGYSVYFSDFSKNGDKAEIELYTVRETGVHSDAIFYDAAMVAVSKNIKTADVNYTSMDVPFNFSRFIGVDSVYPPSEN